MVTGGMDQWGRERPQLGQKRQSPASTIPQRQWEELKRAERLRSSSRMQPATRVRPSSSRPTGPKLSKEAVVQRPQQTDQVL